MKPSDIPLVDYAVNIGIALVGAAVKFARDVQLNWQAWDRTRIAIEAFITTAGAGFVGMLTFWLLTSWKVDPLYAAFGVGMMGHMGPEGLALLKEWWSHGLRSRQQPPPPQG